MSGRNDRKRSVGSLRPYIRVIFHHTIIFDETGFKYDKAIDPEFKHRIYHKSENEIIDHEPPEDIPEEVQVE